MFCLSHPHTLTIHPPSPHTLTIPPPTPSHPHHPSPHTLTPSLAAELSSIQKEITQELRQADSVCHALKLRTAWLLRNYHSFFRLYRVTPNDGRWLVDMFVVRERKAALRVITKA